MHKFGFSQSHSSYVCRPTTAKLRMCTSPVNAYLECAVHFPIRCIFGKRLLNRRNVWQFPAMFGATPELCNKAPHATHPLSSSPLSTVCSQPINVAREATAVTPPTLKIAKSDRRVTPTPFHEFTPNLVCL